MDVDLYVRESGAGAPLVLLHAFPLNSAMWLPQREGLADVCRVITPDFRGFGGSPLGVDEPSLDVLANDVARMLDQMKLDTVVLGGLSMGGYVCMAFLRRHLSRVQALVLADTKGSADLDQARQNRERIADALDADPNSSVLVDDVLPNLVGDTTMTKRPLVYGRVKGLVQQTPAVAAAWAQRAMAARGDSFDILGTVAVPTLLVFGEEDKLATAADISALAETIVGSTVVRIPGAGHLSAVETPDEFNAAVRRFLAEAGLPASL